MVTERVPCSLNSAAMPKRGVTDVNLTDDSGSDSAYSYSYPYSVEAPVLDKQQEDERDKQDEEEERDEEQEEKHEEPAPKEQRGRSRSTGRHSRESAVAETGRTSQDPPAATNKPHISVGGDSPRRAKRSKPTVVLRERRHFCKGCRMIISKSDMEAYNESGRCVDCNEEWAAYHGRRRQDKRDCSQRRKRASSPPSKRRRRTSPRPRGRGSRADSR